MKFTKEWILAALERAIKTAAQVTLSFITLGMAAHEVDWKYVASVALMAFIYSLLTSIVFGIPEATSDGTLLIDTTGVTDKWLFSIDKTPIEEISQKKSIRLTIDNTARLSDPGDENFTEVDE